MSQKIESKRKSGIAKYIATVGGSGFLPKAPGTWGTLASMPLAVLGASLAPVAQMALFFFILFVGTFFVHLYLSQFKDGNISHDRQEIVIDEAAGIFLTFILMPITWQTVATGFILFRFFDALKPWPISYLDKKIKGAFGVMIDDVAAGLAANICLQILLQKTAWLGTQISSW